MLLIPNALRLRKPVVCAEGASQGIGTVYWTVEFGSCFRPTLVGALHRVFPVVLHQTRNPAAKSVDVPVVSRMSLPASLLMRRVMFVDEVAVQVSRRDALVGDPQDGALFVLVSQEVGFRVCRPARWRGPMVGSQASGRAYWIMPIASMVVFCSSRLQVKRAESRKVGEGAVFRRAVSHQPTVAQEDVLAAHGQASPAGSTAASIAHSGCR